MEYLHRSESTSIFSSIILSLSILNINLKTWRVDSPAIINKKLEIDKIRILHDLDLHATENQTPGI